jgi:hypothetical protein
MEDSWLSSEELLILKRSLASYKSNPLLLALVFISALTVTILELVFAGIIQPKVAIAIGTYHRNISLTLLRFSK